MNLKSEELFWKKKEFLSFISSILVLFIHSYFAPEITGDSFVYVFNHKFSFFFSRSITQFAVPMFFMLSGISFFKNYDNKKYFKKIKSRIFTLVIPYLLWNTVWMLWEIITSGSGDPYSLTLTSILKGIFFYDCNMPFWFIFDIIVFSFAAPIIFMVVRNKYVGIGAISALAVLSLFGIHIPTDLFYYPTSIVFYLIGALIGCHYFDRIAQKSTKPMQYASLAVFAAYIILKNVVPQELHIRNYLIDTVVYTVAVFTLWSITDMFIERLKSRAIYRRSFAIYAMHLNIAIIMLKILSLCLPQSPWLEIPKFIIMCVSTIIIINFACIFLEKYFPKIYALFMGNRVKKP